MKLRINESEFIISNNVKGKLLSKDDLMKLENNNEFSWSRWGLPADSRTKRPYNRSFTHWEPFPSRELPLSNMQNLVNIINNDILTMDDINFYLSGNYIITNPFKVYKDEYRQYRWLLDSTAKKVLTT
jgi:hypothetical protein